MRQGCAGHIDVAKFWHAVRLQPMAQPATILSWSIASLHGDEQAVVHRRPLPSLHPLRWRAPACLGPPAPSRWPSACPGRRGPTCRPGPQLSGPAAQSAVTNPNGVVDHDHDRGGHDGAGLADARPVHAGQAADVARRTGPHPAALTRRYWIAPPMYSKDVYSYLAQSEIGRTDLTSTGWVRRPAGPATCSPCRCPACMETPAPYNCSCDRCESRRCFKWKVHPTHSAGPGISHQRGTGWGSALWRRRGQRCG